MGTDEDNGTSIACSIAPSTRALVAAPIAQANMVMIVVLPALASVPFRMPAIAFWMYVSASLIFIIGVFKIFNELPQEQGVGKIMPFGRLFFAIPMAVFGSEHFTITADIAALVPRWIPAHTFWVYLVGAGFICAALSITVLVQARLASALVGMTMLIFVLRNTCREFRCKNSLPSGFPGEFS